MKSERISPFWVNGYQPFSAEVEKQDADKRLTEIREAKEALLKIQRDLQDVIKAEDEAAMVLQEAISSSDNIINGICNAIVKAEQNTRFKATIKFEHVYLPIYLTTPLSSNAMSIFFTTSSIVRRSLSSKQ